MGIKTNEMIKVNGIGTEFSEPYGIFEVRTNDKIVKFNDLDEAVEYYTKIKVEKTLWDLTHGLNDLLFYHQQKSKGKKIKY